MSIENLMEGCDLFAVYDGHSGAEVAKLSKALLYKRIQESIYAAGPDILGRTEDMIALLKAAFIEHNKYLASVIATLDDSGSTATVGIVTPSRIYMAYIGDSPCCMLNPRTGLIIEEMGKHEPSLAGETARIQAAGGFVEIDEYGTPRVDGQLAVARAFGDFSLSWRGATPPAGADWTKMKITAHPDVVCWKRPELGVLAIMSDGLVESDSAVLKPLAQVAHDIQKGLEANQYNLKKAADAVVRGHVLEQRERGPYQGDDLSLILVDVGLGAGQAGGAVPHHLVQGLLVPQKPPTRKARRRRARTGKKTQLIKIFSC